MFFIPRPFLSFFTAVAFVAVVGPASAKRLNIIVKAEAEEDYLERAEGMEYQTYHLVKGKYHGGSTRDRSLEETHFEDLFESLVETLETRKMYPELDRHNGDLLIMVSWGVTSLDDDFYEQQGMGGANDMNRSYELARASDDEEMSPPFSSPPISESSADLSVAQSQGTVGNYQKTKNVGLLGLEGLRRSRDPFGAFDASLGDALEEERYFVILNAFDYQHLLSEKELKQLWRARYNTRALGVDFGTAFRTMNESVAGVIGLQMERLSTIRADTREDGNVSLGDVEMVEMSAADKRELAE